MKNFVSVLRTPDAVFGATEASPFRFEERASAACDVKYDYTVGEKSARVTVYPSGAPVKYLKLRFRGDMNGIESVYGDQWERCCDGALFEWRSVMPHRALGWFCYVKMGGRIGCYGVKTGADCFAFWQVDLHGVTLFLNLKSGSVGTDLAEPILACEVVEHFSDEGEDAYTVAKRFSAMLCDAPVLPAEPIFGVNNWYWAYGKISKESIREETDYLMQMCTGAKHRPYMIIDDGWQLERALGENKYNGGPWTVNSNFTSMADTAEDIHKRGAKAGIWFRPLLTLSDIPERARLSLGSGGSILDPTHPYTLEYVREVTANIRAWGYELIKHDFTTIDAFGVSPLSTEMHTANMCKSDRAFFDKSITTATAIKRLYAAIQEGAGGAEVIGCNAIGHLCAGIHSVYRTGNDTSGNHFELTRRHGVNSMMRLPLNDTLYRADPDCAAFTDRVDAELNLDYLEMCALTGCTALASVTPHILNGRQMARINEIFLTADEDKRRYGIADYATNACPEKFVSEDGSVVKEYDWTRAYDGARVDIVWSD
ncbi:MAG: hypothetical protein IKL79_04360 [Clostridia bacterium]|nr:hypothetical protein [Clostridia bacterium]